MVVKNLILVKLVQGIPGLVLCITFDSLWCVVFYLNSSAVAFFGSLDRYFDSIY